MITDERTLIDRFFAGPPFAVVGASADPSKFGHKVLAHYLRHGLTAFPVHPREAEILGQKVYPDLRSLPEPVRHVSVITPPSITELVVDDAAEAGVEILWLQPGAESLEAVSKARELGIEVIHGGACVLVELT